MSDRAQQAAKQLDIPKTYGSYSELLADPEIEVVYIPLPNHLHVPWSIKALEAGKHVYTEKPLAVTRVEGKTLIETARKRGRLIGGAPDTFLGAGIQTCRKLIRAMTGISCNRRQCPESAARRHMAAKTLLFTRAGRALNESMASWNKMRFSMSLTRLPN